MPGTHALPGRNILGVSLERSFSELQPHKDTRPDARRSFVVYQSSEVEVRVNGRTVRTFRLPPGEYELSDLPLVTGGNRITVEVTENSGRVRTYDFTVFYDHDLLKPGLSEWHVAAGFPPDYDIDGRHYVFDRPALYAEYRRGILENLTGEAAFQAAHDGVSLDLGMSTENSFGSLFLRAAASYQSQALGYAFGFDWQITEFGDWGGPLNAVRLSADYDGETFSQDSNEARGDSLRLGSALGFSLPEGIQGFASLNYVDRHAEEARLNASLSLSKTVGRDLSWSLSAGYRQVPGVSAEDGWEGQWSARFGVNYRFGPEARLSTDYDVAERTVTTELDQHGRTGNGSWAAEIEFTHDNDKEASGRRGENALAGDLRYAGNRFVGSIGHRRRFGGLQDRVDIRSSATLATALAYADGRLAWGRPVNGAFAIIDLPSEITGGTLQVAPSAQGAAAETNDWGPALVSSLPPYIDTTLPVAASDVPADYDPGAGAFTLRPAYKAGYALTAGTAGTRAIRGRLVDVDGEPVSLLVGHARPADEADATPSQFFTSQDGRFFIQGLKPGSWTLTLPDRADLQFTFEVKPSKERIIDVGTLHAHENR
jgi:outer membrane usher protein